MLTIQQINTLFYRGIRWYGYKRMSRLRKRGYVTATPLVKNGRKAGTCYYITQKGLDELGMPEDRYLESVIVTHMQDHRKRLGDLYIHLRQFGQGWEWLNSRRAKNAFRLWRSTRLDGVLKYGNQVIALYVLGPNPQAKTLKQIEVEVMALQDRQIHTVMILCPGATPTFESTGNARRFYVLPFGQGLRLLSDWAGYLPRIAEHYLGPHPQRDPGRNALFASYETDYAGHRAYVVDLLSNDLVRRYHLKAYTLDRAQREDRRVIVFSSGAEPELNPHVYPHIRVLTVPGDLLAPKGVDDDEQDEDPGDFDEQWPGEVQAPV